MSRCSPVNAGHRPAWLLDLHRRYTLTLRELRQLGTLLHHARRRGEELDPKSPTIVSIVKVATERDRAVRRAARQATQRSLRAKRNDQQHRLAEKRRAA